MESIINNIVTALIKCCNQLVAVFLQFLCKDLIGNDYIPTLSNMQKVLLGEHGAANMATIMAFFRSCALIVLVGLFFWHGFLFAFGNLVELKESVFKAIARIVSSGIIIYSDVLYKILNAILTVASKAFTASNSMLDGLQKESAYNIWTIVTDGDYGFSTIDEATGYIVANLNVLLGLILGCVILYQFLKLCVEMIQRFVTIFVLFISMPLAASLLGSAITQNCFFTYIQVFVVEVVSLIYLRIWISLTLFVMGNVAGTVIGLLSVVAFIKIGQSIKEIMRSMGLNTSNTGPALLDSISHTGLAMMSMARMAAVPIGAAGAGVTALGRKEGSTGLVKTGLLMQGKDASNRAITNELTKPKFTPLNTASQSHMDSLYRKGDNHGFMSMYNNLSSSDKGRYLQHLNNDVINGGSGSLNNKLMRGGLVARVTGINERTGGLNVDILDKQALDSGRMQIIASGTYDNNKNLNAISSFDTQDINGNSKYLNINSANINPDSMEKASDTFNDDIITQGNIYGIDKNIDAAKELASSEHYIKVDNVGSATVYDKDGLDGKIQGHIYSNNTMNLGTPGNALGMLDNNDNSIPVYGQLIELGYTPREITDKDKNGKWVELKVEEKSGRTKIVRFSPYKGQELSRNEKTVGHEGNKFVETLIKYLDN